MSRIGYGLLIAAGLAIPSSIIGGLFGPYESQQSYQPTRNPVSSSYHSPILDSDVKYDQKHGYVIEVHKWITDFKKRELIKEEINRGQTKKYKIYNCPNSIYTHNIQNAGEEYKRIGEVANKNFFMDHGVERINGMIQDGASSKRGLPELRYCEEKY